MTVPYNQNGTGIDQSSTHGIQAFFSSKFVLRLISTGITLHI